MREADIQRFWSKVDKNGANGCWLWIAGCFGVGYGQFWLDGTNELAHRISWMLAGNPLTDLHLCHRCDIRPCVNPSHLFEGTAGDNARDRQAKGRGNAPHGERQGRHKLTTEQVLEIKAMFNSEPSNLAIARKFGVNRQTIAFIRQGKNWKHLNITLIQEDSQLCHAKY